MKPYAVHGLSDMDDEGQIVSAKLAINRLQIENSKNDEDLCKVQPPYQGHFGICTTNSLLYYRGFHYSGVISYA